MSLMNRSAPRGHDWAPPPPGQGSVEICQICGLRRLPGVDQTACNAHGETIVETEHQYDPLP